MIKRAIDVIKAELLAIRIPKLEFTIDIVEDTKAELDPITFSAIIRIIFIFVKFFYFFLY